MSVRARFNLVLVAEETIELSEDLNEDPTVIHQISGGFGTFSATSATPVTKAWSDTRSLAAGTNSIDLTALVNAARNDIDFTVLKVQAVKIVAATNNTANVLFSPAGSNGYNLFGSSDGKISLAAGCQALFIFPEGLADVSATVKAITVTSSDVDAAYSILLVAG